MKEAPDQTESPKERLLAALGQFSLHINNLQTFYKTTTELLHTGVDQIEHSVIKTTKEQITKPEMQEVLGVEACKSISKNQTLFSQLSKSIAKRSVKLSTQMVGTATLVFAHTVLDELISECCYISFAADPSDWYALIAERKIDLRALQSANPQELLHQKALEFVREKASLSMCKRFSLLNQICIPKLKGEKPSTALVDVEKLATFDQIRHEIVHGQPFVEKVADIDDTVLLVACFGMAELCLIGKAYNLFDKEIFTKEAFLSKFLTGMQDDLPEFKELISVFNQLTELTKKMPK